MPVALQGVLSVVPVAGVGGAETGVPGPAGCDEGLDGGQAVAVQGGVCQDGLARLGVAGPGGVEGELAGGGVGGDAPGQFGGADVLGAQAGLLFGAGERMWAAGAGLLLVRVAGGVSAPSRMLRRGSSAGVGAVGEGLDRGGQGAVEGAVAAFAAG